MRTILLLACLAATALGQTVEHGKMLGEYKTNNRPMMEATTDRLSDECVEGITKFQAVITSQKNVIEVQDMIIKQLKMQLALIEPLVMSKPKHKKPAKAIQCCMTGDQK